VSRPQKVHERPQEIIERALSASRADSCIAISDEVTTANLRWANNTLTTNGVTRTSELTVIAVVGEATGVVSRQGVAASEVTDLVRAAERAAGEAPPAVDAGPLEDNGVSVGNWDDPPAATSVGVFADLAGSLGAELHDAGTRDELLFGFANHEMRTTYLGTSAGVRSRHDQPTGHFEINAKSEDYIRSAWAGVPTRDFTDVDVPALTGDLSRRLAWAKRSVDLPPGRYETILPPTAVADLMIYLYWSCGARDAHDGRTVFSRPGGGTRVGERLTDVAVTLRSDPAAAGIECGPFAVAYQSSSDRSVFDNGLRLAPTAWISNGVLSSLVQSRYSAGLTGLETTPYIDNLIMDGPVAGAGNQERLIAGTDRGLLLTCLWYIREVDPQTLLLTGLTRDGVYLVEGGEVTGAVNNFRFNESPVDVLTRITAAGNPVVTLPREWSDYFARTRVPALRVADFNMSTVSQAS
jgi:predicted Zn-dependent protease